MTKSETVKFAHPATTPRAAAIAGILFAILFITSIALIRLSMPSDLADMEAWTDATRGRVSMALGLMPFAGLAFLWFVGVARDRLGTFEDRFFATVFLGSGLLFLAMTFCAVATAAGMLAAYQLGEGQVMTKEVYLFGRSIISQMFNTYGLRMAAVFMFSLSTLWLRTGVMPRILSYLTYAVVVVMLVSISQNLWMVLIFPAWVLIISVYILILNLRREPSRTTDGMTAKSTAA
ncbi:MAG: hypothetical protein FJ014_09630 [Chloroflexi bacterium]|nr:hypothetical protein [Chloroflexota bacterium]